MFCMEVPPKKSKGALLWSAQEMVPDSSQLFNLIAKDIMRSSTWKLKPGKFRLETRRYIFFFSSEDN